MTERTIRGRHKLDLVNDFASGLSTADVCEKYNISTPYANKLRKEWQLEIEAKRLGEETEQGPLWITSLEKRLAEYEAIYEQHEEFVDPKSVRIRLDCLRAVSELTGQLPQRIQQTPNQVEFTYKVEGVDPADVA